MSKIKNILHISDTHGFHEIITNDVIRKIKDEGVDIISHAGDFSNALIHRNHEYDSFLKWYSELPGDIDRVLVCGNHEIKVEGDEDVFRKKCEDLGITFLFHESAEVQGIKFFGSPYTPRFGTWAYNINRFEAEIYWDAIPTDTQVLVTHGPPYGVGDRVGVRSVGDMALLHAVQDLCAYKSDHLIHQFGHIHEDQGYFMIEDIPTYTAINSSILDANYDVDYGQLFISRVKVL